MERVWLIPVLVSILIIGSLASAYAIVFDPPITFLNPTPDAGDEFGFSVSIDGNNILVGAPFDNAAGSMAGAAYLFDATTGNLLHTFLDPTIVSPNDNFGRNVAIDGNNALVSAALDDTGTGDTGAAYLFDATTGNLLHSFLNPTPAISDHFGDGIAIEGSNVVIGASSDDTSGPNAGIAYLFDTSGTLLQTFTSPASAGFGQAVSISGNNVLIGAFTDDTGANDAGEAYLFDATTGALLHTFLNPTPAASDLFGFSVSIDGNNVLIGARADATEGFAYLYDATTGALLHTFLNPTPVVGDLFGWSVSIDGNDVLIGARGDNTGANNAGAVYLFDTSGNLLHTFLNPTPAADEFFGNDVSSGSPVLIGTPGPSGFGTTPGNVYLFLEEALVGGPPVGGTYIPIDTTTLPIAGAQSTSMWMIPVILAGIGIGVFVIKRKK